MCRRLISLLASCSMLLAACATTNPGLGRTVHGAGTTALPSGLRLLDSDEGHCRGVMQVGPASAVAIQPGENAAFEVTGPVIGWSCLHGASRDLQRHSCPNGTTHVRITRAALGDELLLECYGS